MRSEDSRGPRRLGCRDVPPVATDHSRRARRPRAARCRRPARARRTWRSSSASASPPPGTRSPWWAGRSATRCSGVLGDDLDLTTDARPEQVLEIVVGLGRRGLGRRHRVRHRRGAQGRAQARDHDVPRRGLRPRVAQARGRVRRRRSPTTSCAATSPSTRWRCGCPSLELVDLHGGIDDLAAGVLRTPGTPEESFSDDPLRMMRAARFASTLRLHGGARGGRGDDRDVRAPGDRVGRAGARRAREARARRRPARGPGAAGARPGSPQLVLPELPALALEVDEHHRHKDVYEHTLIVLEQAIELETTHEPVSGPDFVLRFAALMHDVGKPRTRRFEDDGRVSFHHHEMVGARMTRKRMQALRFSNDRHRRREPSSSSCTCASTGTATASGPTRAVRRYVRDAGDQLARLHKLTRADCTTRNKRKADGARRAPTTSSRSASRGCPRRRSSPRSARRSTATGSWSCSTSPPGREVGEAYRMLLEAAPRPRPHDRGRGRGRAASLVGRPHRVTRSSRRSGRRTAEIRPAQHLLPSGPEG